MAGEPTFEVEEFEKKLNALTVNSRAIIADLTIVAERYPGSCDTIVELVENRIKRCLPPHKLNSIYLLDSIVKNVGSPYNVVFGRNLFRTFSETYLIVPDTPTRQSLINLFKTWKGAKTLGGTPLFAPEVLARIEQFIIKATSLAAEAEQAAPVPARVTPDMLLRECRCLLEYCIALDKRADYLGQFPSLLTKKQARFFAGLQKSRHAAVFSTNAACDMIVDLLRARESPDSLAQKFVGELQLIRTLYDGQNFQHESITQSIGPAIAEKIKENASLETALRAKRQKARYYEKNAIKTELLDPNPAMFELLAADPQDDLFLQGTIESWGHSERPQQPQPGILPPASPSPSLSIPPISPTPTSASASASASASSSLQVTSAELEASLLLGFGNFAPSLLKKLSITPMDKDEEPYTPPILPQAVDSIVAEDPLQELHYKSPIDGLGASSSIISIDDEDDYIPSFQPDPYENEYPTNMPSLAQVGGIMRSSLKRQSQDPLRVVKRVRFDV